MRTRTAVRNLIFISLLPPLLAGCADYKWQWNFQSPEQLRKTEETAAQQHKIVFIFYKWYLDSDANRMHGDVLADNQVGSLFTDTVNILVDKSAGPAYEQYVTKYGVNSAPACILVAPDGRYKVLRGYIPKDRFIEQIQRAKAELSEQPHRSAPTKIAP